MTELQIALDGELAAALDVLAQVQPYVDIAEIGTPLIFREGMRAVREIRAAYPGLTLVADLKIMDAGLAEADIAFCAGADRVTVMALASDATIAGALASARSRGKRVMVDMMQVADPLARGAATAGAGLRSTLLAYGPRFAVGAGLALRSAGPAASGAAGRASGYRRRHQAGDTGTDSTAVAASDHRRLGHHRRARSRRDRARQFHERIGHATTR